MSEQFEWFRDTVTCKIAKYPAGFGDLFPTLEKIDSEDAACIKCTIVTDAEPEAPVAKTSGTTPTTTQRKN